MESMITVVVVFVSFMLRVRLKPVLPFLSVRTFPEARAPNNGLLNSAPRALSPGDSKPQFRRPFVPNHHLVAGRRF